MTIKFYNTANRKKQVFKPLKKGQVAMYVCGVTVYDFCHIGHARSAIVFDVLARFLRARGFDVTYVRNFTDIDDKIINRSNELGKDTAVLAQEYIDAFHQDMKRLYVMEPDFEPKATEHIEGMIEMIQILLDKEYAYPEGHDVYFSVEKFKDYGRLSGRKLEDMKAGSRISIDKKKRHPMDFVLWKGAKPNEPAWNSPWGPGRPGWHLECSVMSNHYLGSSFDIHGGGKDLLFPHHENERAQSLCANDGIFAKYWIHNGFVIIESEKMSKSTGNFLTIRDALESYHPEVLRLFLLSRHYRSPLDFTHDDVLASQSGLVRIYRTMKRLEGMIGPFEADPKDSVSVCLRDRSEDDRPTSFLRQFFGIMDEDLNSAGAIGVIFDKVRQINKLLDSQEARSIENLAAELADDRHQLYLACHILGIMNETPDEFFEQLTSKSSPVDADTIEAMLKERAEAKLKKEWVRADEIRDSLKKMGVILEDGPQGVVWRLDV
jgi:cysteinyl-tRNA synthetase